MTVPFLDLRATYLELQSEIDAAVCRVLQSGQYILGPEVEAFEQEWAAFCDAGFAIGVANGLDALILSLRALDIGPGDEVIVPSNTYIATWLAVTAVGATPCPVEPDPITHNINVASVAAAITPKTKVLLPVHLYGQPADMTPLLDLARQHDLYIVEDAAQAPGAQYKGKRIGAHGDLICWSFYPGKNLGAFGDGGAVTTNSPDLAARIRSLRNYGSTQKYVHEEAGYNSRLDPIQAAVLRVKLAKLSEWNDRRKAIATLYSAKLAQSGLILPKHPEYAEPSWHLYVIRSKDRVALQKRLENAGIGSLIHYPLPPHMQGAYLRSGLLAGQFSVARQLAGEVLSLPIGPHLSPTQADVVVAAITA
jgi:dTDP-4-amino-4,6-dideoxygalactose transaminase